MRTFQKSGTASLMLAAFVLGSALAVAGCGSSSAKSSPSATPAASATADSGGRGQMGRRTQSPALQTSIAEGTPPPFGNRTPQPDVQTSIAEGTPQAFGNRTPSGAIATAIAQGTPASALRGGFGGGGGGGGRTITALAQILGIDETQVRSELQAAGASLAGVAAAHGIDRPTLRQRLIDAIRQTLNTAVTSGSMTQDQADQSAAQFEANVDGMIDRVGAAPAPAPAR